MPSALPTRSSYSPRSIRRNCDAPWSPRSPSDTGHESSTGSAIRRSAPTSRSLAWARLGVWSCCPNEKEATSPSSRPSSLSPRSWAVCTICLSSSRWPSRRPRSGWFTRAVRRCIRSPPPKPSPGPQRSHCASADSAGWSTNSSTSAAAISTSPSVQKSSGCGLTKSSVVSRMLDRWVSPVPTVDSNSILRPSRPCPAATGSSSSLATSRRSRRLRRRHPLRRPHQSTAVPHR